MQSFPPTVILRHQKENLKKCTLHGLENRPDFEFYAYPTDNLPNFSGYILLTIDASPLDTKLDFDKGLFILDATWRYADKMHKHVESHTLFEMRSIPNEIRTAYPRHQTGCSFPEQGLASIEAIYIAYLLLGRNADNLLINYYWKNEFLTKNKCFFESLNKINF